MTDIPQNLIQAMVVPSKLHSIQFNSIQRYFIDPRGEIRIPVQPIQTYIMTQDKGGTGHRGFAAHSQALPLLDEKEATLGKQREKNHISHFILSRIQFEIAKKPQPSSTSSLSTG
ncbi:hypothetical protein AMECASPLE_032042 [Ameca splendens]|uniref:Uncharacterized protein n=1 Tax=Ameca splendens TaxID=208324 RepID=A0ABV0YU46_9TELE